MTCWNCGKKKSWFSPTCGRCGTYDEGYWPSVRFAGLVLVVIVLFIGAASC